jgi:dimethylglycine dehydrogenase
VALGYVNADAIDDNDEYEVAVLGIPHRARRLQKPLFDPEGERLRG